VAGRTWERLGFARLGDYARERFGLSARQMQDLAHVDGRLGELPQVAEALVTGRLSWTKARLVARIARPGDDEARWIRFAARVRSGVLEHEVRAIDRGSVEGGALEVDEDGLATWPSEGIVVRCTPAVQAKFHRARQVARRVAGEALPTWACMEAVAAEAIAASSDVAAHLPDAPAAATSASPRTGPAPSPPAGDPGDAFELDARFRELVAREQRLDAELASLVRRCPHFAEQVGISPRKARALIRLDRVGDRCPALREAFQEGRLSWVQAHALAGLLSLPETAPFRDGWVAHAERVTVRRLQEDVDSALECAARGEPPEPPGQEPRQTRARDAVSEKAEADAAETARFSFSTPIEVARLLRAVVCSVRRRLDRTEGAAWGWLFDHAFESWDAGHAKVRREHRVFARDGWRCTVPGCSSYRNLHDHHIVFRAVGGNDDLANRTTLCAFHHLRGVHAGRVRVTGTAPQGLRFELGLRDGRASLLRYRSSDQIAG
jgi:hypothetical protein